MPEIGGVLDNPAVIGSGIGGVIAVLLILVLYKMLVRIDDSIHAFTEGQAAVIKEISDVGEKVARSVSEALNRIHEDNIEAARYAGNVNSKLDVLLDRTSQVLQNIAFHRGVSEPPIAGTPPPVIVTHREDVEP